MVGLVVASDGMWDKLGRTEVIKVFEKYFETANSRKACLELATKSRAAWMKVRVSRCTAHS